jgi:RHS repeat-associated protein
MITSQNGSVYEVVTTASKTVRWLQYDAFGNKTEAAGPAGQGDYAYTPRQSYTGQTWIASAGMYDYGARFYDPRTGRFISNDPAQDGTNWSAYVGNNPATFNDPWGLTAITASTVGASSGGRVTGALAQSGGGGGGDLFSKVDGGVPRWTSVFVSGISTPVLSLRQNDLPSFDAGAIASNLPAAVSAYQQYRIAEEAVGRQQQTMSDDFSMRNILGNIITDGGLAMDDSRALGELRSEMDRRATTYNHYKSLLGHAGIDQVQMMRTVQDAGTFEFHGGWGYDGVAEAMLARDGHSSVENDGFELAFTLPFMSAGLSLMAEEGIATAATSRGGVSVRVRFANPTVTWVDEAVGMSDEARLYNSGAEGARSNLLTRQPQAPSIPGPIRPVRFDGEAPGLLIDRKLAVVTTAKVQNQALRQAAALRQNGLRGMWEVPDAAQAARAKTMFSKLGIDNIDVRIVPR